VSTLKSSAEDLTLNADGSGNDIIFQSNGSNVATLDQAGLLTATTFAGSGASLTALPAAQITGTHASFLSTGVDDNATAVKLTVTDSGININGDITFSSASQGICLGVTSNVDANTLDDYEEGSWTPDFANGTPTWTTVYNRIGRYTKIGNMVWVWMEIYVGAVSFSDATQLMEISGLPFSTGGIGNTFGLAHSSHVQTQNLYTSGSTYNNGGVGDTNYISLQPSIVANASTFKMSIAANNNIGWSQLKNAAFHNGSALVVGFSYRVTA